MLEEFTTCLSCIDGRVHLPVINWITGCYSVKYVDLITYPGMIKKIIADEHIQEDIFSNITTSIQKHCSSSIFIVAHNDCAGNPVDERTQIEQISIAVEKISKLFPGINVTGLWVNEQLQVMECHSSYLTG